MYSHEGDIVRRPKTRSRGLSVSVMIGLMLVYYSFCISVNLTALSSHESQTLLHEIYHFPAWVIPAVTFCFSLNVVWAFLLLMWKKWAFFALLLTSLVLFAISVGGMEPLLSAWQAGELVTFQGLGLLSDTPLLCLLALIVLFGFLRAGGPRSVWSQLD